MPSVPLSSQRDRLAAHDSREPQTLPTRVETRIGFGRKTAVLRDIILCVDQSGSMAGSIVYSGVMAAVMASLRAVRTSLVFFDTAVT